MTGISRTSADLDPRRRRILYRCWHRGIREMDLVLGQFAEAEIADLSPDELETMLDSFTYLVNLRLKRQLRDIAGGNKPTNAAK